MCSDKASGKTKQLRQTYGFDEVAIVPGDVTLNPDQTSTEFSIEDHTFSFPIVTSAMDSVVDVDFAIAFGKLGGLAILNLDGIQARYENPDEVLSEIARASDEEGRSVQTDERSSRFTEFERSQNHGHRPGALERPDRPPHVEPLPDPSHGCWSEASHRTCEPQATLPW